jgi:hypothetical protein
MSNDRAMKESLMRDVIVRKHIRRHHDQCVYYVDKLVTPPKRGKCLIQDYWHTRGEIYSHVLKVYI